MSLSIKDNTEDIKIKDIINVKNENKYCLKILNNDLNLIFKLNK